MPTSHRFKHMGLSGYGTSKAVCCTQARHSLCHRTTYDLCAAPGSSWLLLGWCLYVFGVASTIDRSLSILQVMFGWAPVRKFLAWTRARTWMNQSSIKLCCVGFPTLECQQGFTLLNWGGYLFRWDHMVQKPWSSLCPLVLGKSVLSWAIVLKIQGGITWCFLLFFIVWIWICPKKTDHWANPDSTKQLPWERKHVTPLTATLAVKALGHTTWTTPTSPSDWYQAAPTGLVEESWLWMLGQQPWPGWRKCVHFVMSDGFTISDVFVKCKQKAIMPVNLGTYLP